MTAETIIAIVGDEDQDNREIALLRAADKAATLHLKNHHAVLMADMAPHYDIFQDLALKAFDWTAKAQAEIEQWDRVTEHIQTGRPEGHPSETAAAFYTPQMSAAFYFGLSLGLRLNGGAGDSK